MTKQEQAVQAALQRIRQGEIVCAAIRDGGILAAQAGRGVAPVLQMFKNGQLTGSFLVDKVVGKAAAMIMTRGGISGCHGINVSRAALDWFGRCNVPVTYDAVTDHIVNRTGDGMCPMEQAVLGLQEDTDIVTVLEQTLIRIKNANK